jgi:F0F1-type ATP synthase membrane subunit b/b'
MSQLNVPLNLEAVKDEVSFREFLTLANQELEDSLSRIRGSREESEQLLEQIEEVLSNLRGRE